MMVPACPKCGVRPSTSDSLARGAGGRIKCRQCGTPLVLVRRPWRTLFLLLLLIGVGVAVWNVFVDPQDRILAYVGMLVLSVPVMTLMFRLEVRDVSCDAARDEEEGDARQVSSPVSASGRVSSARR
ncbi:MAG: hypothetical protein D6757_07700 [Alphaproteobacteria bacterium]|nr:MAG: hypothetical protein D6757_07700 [Alphaproteobacteria bacterium]